MDAPSVAERPQQTETAPTEAETAARPLDEPSASLGDLWAAVGTELGQLQSHVVTYLQVRTDQVRTTVQGLVLLLALLAGLLFVMAVILAAAAIMLMIGTAEGLVAGLDLARWQAYAVLGGSTLLLVFLVGWGLLRASARRRLISLQAKYDPR